MSKEDFFNGCFPSNWVELDITKESVSVIENKKDVATLLAELEDIKNTFEKLEDKKMILNNMLKLYRGEFAR